MNCDPPLAAPLHRMQGADEGTLPDQDLPMVALLQRIVRPSGRQHQAATMSDDMRAEIVEALGHMCFAAKREMPKTRRLTTDPPTPWDQRHQSLNHLLNQLDILNEIEAVTNG